MNQPYPQQPMAPGALPGGRPMRKDGRTLVGAVFTTVALVLVILTTLSHGWLRDPEWPDEVKGGFGLASIKVEARGETEHESYLETLDKGRGDAVVFAAGSLIFAAGNWIMVLFLLLGVIFGFVRWSGGRPAGVPFAMTLVAMIVGFVFFLAWLAIAVLGGDMWSKTNFAWCVWVWWLAMALTITSMVMFAMARSFAAFGTGFQGSGQVMGAGQGLVGGSYAPPSPGAAGMPPQAPPAAPGAPPPQAPPAAPGAAPAQAAPWPPPQAPASPAPGQPAPWPPPQGGGTPQCGGGGWPPPR